MLTVEHDTGFLSKALGIADRTVSIGVNIKSQGRILLDTILVQTRHALGFVRKAAAVMPTGENLVTGRVHEVDALIVAADILESGLDRGRSTLDNLLTESALA